MESSPAARGGWGKASGSGVPKLAGEAAHMGDPDQVGAPGEGFEAWGGDVYTHPSCPVARVEVWVYVMGGVDFFEVKVRCRRTVASGRSWEDDWAMPIPALGTWTSYYEAASAARKAAGEIAVGLEWHGFFPFAWDGVPYEKG